jgi:REP element-mobilizing transposase RayT
MMIFRYVGVISNSLSPPPLQTINAPEFCRSKEKKNKRYGNGVSPLAHSGLVWEHRIHDEFDFTRLVDYVHYNPVKHGYVDRAIDWPYK